MAEKRMSRTDLVFRAATPSRWEDVEKLFGERGACGGCWCMAWRLRNKDWVAGKGAKNKRAFKKLVSSGKKPGILAYHDGEPVAWCAIAPRRDYVYLERSRVLKPVDDRPVWSVSCLFVTRPYRRRGVSAHLLRAAAEMAAKRGARIVEGYPTEPTMKKTPDPFLWLGLPSSFRRAGFREVARRSPSRPIMRRIVLGLVLLLSTAAATPSVQAKQRQVAFKGRHVFEAHTGLTALPDETHDHLFLSSTTHNFWLVLPYSETWILESSKKTPLQAQDDRYVVSIRIENREQGSDEEFLRGLLAELAEARDRPAHDATFFEVRKRAIMRVKSRGTDPDRPWSWTFLTVAPRKNLWYLLELTLDGGEELERETEEQLLDICGIGFGADFDN